MTSRPGPRLRAAPCQAIWIGQMAYADAWALQKRVAAARGADLVPDTLLWVEHPHTYTLGSAGRTENVLLSAEELAARGIALIRADRGGDVTYHGPGQLVGYPILKLPGGSDGLHADVLAYVRQLEQVLIEALAGYGIAAKRYPGYTGTWVEGPDGLAKIAAIGVRVTTRRVTLHGFALNVNTDMTYFQGIIPCGIADKPVTSMQALCGHAFVVRTVAATAAAAFAAVFDKRLYAEDVSALNEYRE